MENITGRRAPVRGRCGPSRGLASAGTLCAHSNMLAGAGSALIMALGPPTCLFRACAPQIHGGRYIWPRRAPVRGRCGPARGLASAGTLCAHSDVLVGAGSAPGVVLGPLMSNFTVFVPEIHARRDVSPFFAPVRGRCGPARSLASAGTLCAHNDVLAGAGSALIVALGPLMSNFTVCVPEIHGRRDGSSAAPRCGAAVGRHAVWRVRGHCALTTTCLRGLAARWSWRWGR